MGETPVVRRRRDERGKPALDACLLRRVARAVLPQPPQRRQRAQCEKSRHAIGAEREREREWAPAPCLAPAIPRRQARGEAWWQQGREFRETRLHVIDDPHDIGSAGADFAPDAREAARPGFEIGDADDIVEAIHSARKRAVSRVSAKSSFPDGSGRRARPPARAATGRRYKSAYAPILELQDGARARAAMMSRVDGGKASLAAWRRRLHGAVATVAGRGCIT